MGVFQQPAKGFSNRVGLQRMARMIPATISPQNESKAEAKLFFALKKSSLDDSYFIFHSLDLFKRNLDK
jgi:hypothetical protein